MKLWQKYLFRQLALTFSFLLFCLFAIYCLIDLSIHGVRFLTRGPGSSPLDLLLYYLRHFAIRLDLFMPLAFLLSTFKVLFQLGAHFELVALQMAGLSRKKLLLPFFLFASLLSLIGLANHEYFAGTAFAAAEKFKIAHSKSRKKGARREHIQTLSLRDGSELVYQKYDAEKKELFDVYWIRSDRDLWHCKILSFANEKPIGYFVDHLVRDKLLLNQESLEERIFSDLTLQQDLAPKPFVPYESRPLSTLFFDPPSAESSSHFHHKLALPFLSILVLFAAAPFALVFSRGRPTFLIISLCLFGFVACLTLFDSLLILGENRVLPPAIAMWILPLAISLLSARRFAKL